MRVSVWLCVSELAGEMRAEELEVEGMEWLTGLAASAAAEIKESDASDLEATVSYALAQIPPLAETAIVALAVLISRPATPARKRREYLASIGDACVLLSQIVEAKDEETAAATASALRKRATILLELATSFPTNPSATKSGTEKGTLTGGTIKDKGEGGEDNEGEFKQCEFMFCALLNLSQLHSGRQALSGLRRARDLCAPPSLPLSPDRRDETRPSSLGGEAAETRWAWMELEVIAKTVELFMTDLADEQAAQTECEKLLAEGQALLDSLELKRSAEEEGKGKGGGAEEQGLGARLFFKTKKAAYHTVIQSPAAISAAAEALEELKLLSPPSPPASTPGSQSKNAVPIMSPQFDIPVEADYEVCLELARIATATGHLRESILLCERLLRRNEGDDRVLHRLALNHFMLDETEPALEAIDRALELLTGLPDENMEDEKMEDNDSDRTETSVGHEDDGKDYDEDGDGDGDEDPHTQTASEIPEKTSKEREGLRQEEGVDEGKRQEEHQEEAQTPLEELLHLRSEILAVIQKKDAATPTSMIDGNIPTSNA